jgi:protein-disulfide isomerase
MKFFALALALLLPAMAAAPDIMGNAFGNPNAPITMEIFSDFQCPACKNLHENTLPEIMREFVTPGKVYLIQRYFPLQGHPYGLLSAEYVCAASRVGKFEQTSNILFATQPVWSENGHVEQTVDTVLTPTEAKKVKSLVNDPGVQAQIQHDVLEGRAVPVTQTPTLLVTHAMRRYPIAGLTDYGLLRSFLNDLLKK